VGMKARVEGAVVRLASCEDRGLCDRLRERGYLYEGGEIDPFEAMLQAVRGRLRLEDGSEGWPALLRILEALRVQLKMAIVYLDLRRRYPQVRRGPRKDTFIASGKSGRAIEVLVLEEGEEVTVAQLGLWSQAAASDGHEPVVAIVDRNGQVTYYQARVVPHIL
jgi:tRNA splicing endonuclease